MAVDDTATETTPETGEDGDDVSLASALKEKFGIGRDTPQTEEEILGKPQKEAEKKETAPEAEKKEPEATKEEKPPVAKEEKPPVAKEILAIHRMRRQTEAETRKEREALAAERQKFDEERKQAAGLTRDDIRRRLADDPVALAKELDIDPGDLLNIMAAKVLGKDVPADLKPLRRIVEQDTAHKSEMAALKLEVDKLKESLAQRAEAEDGKAIITEVQKGISDLLAKVPEQFKLVAKQAAKKPDRAATRMFELAVQYAEQYPEDAIPTADELAQFYEDALNDELEAFLGDSETKPVTPAATSPKKPTGARSLSAGDMAGRAGNDELPLDADKANAILALRLRQGVHLPKRQE